MGYEKNLIYPLSQLSIWWNYSLKANYLRCKSIV